MKVFNNFWPLDIWKGSENVTEGPPSTKSVDIEQCGRIIPCKINTFRKKNTSNARDWCITKASFILANLFLKNVSWRSSCKNCVTVPGYRFVLPKDSNFSEYKNRNFCSSKKNKKPQKNKTTDNKVIKRRWFSKSYKSLTSTECWKFLKKGKGFCEKNYSCYFLFYWS